MDKPSSLFSSSVIDEAKKDLRYWHSDREILNLPFEISVHNFGFPWRKEEIIFETGFFVIFLYASVCGWLDLNPRIKDHELIVLPLCYYHWPGLIYIV